MKFLIYTPGPLLNEEFGSVEEAKQYVEKYAPLKRGWTGRWITALNNKAWKYQRFNSKGKLVKGYDVVIHDVEESDVQH